MRNDPDREPNPKLVVLCGLICIADTEIISSFFGIDTQYLHPKGSNGGLILEKSDAPVCHEEC